MLNVRQTRRGLAQLAEGEGPSAPIEGLSATDATRWFQANKYPLLAVAARAPGWLLDDPGFQAQLASEREWYETQRREYALVRDAWLERGVEGLMIKSAGNAPSFPYTSDNIDVEVRPEHGPTARDVLRRLGYVELRNVEEPQKFLFRKFHAGRSISAVHVHEQVGWGVGFMDETALWARRRPSEDDPLVNVPSAEDAILINLAHACYENKLLRFNDLVRVRHALRSAGGQLDWDYMRRVATSRGWLDGLACMVLVYASIEPALFGSSLVPECQRERFTAVVSHLGRVRRWLKALEESSADEPCVDLPLSLSYWFCKWLYYRKVLADPARDPRDRWRDVGVTLAWGVKLKSRVRPQPGLLVSLSGPDGSGKTTHAQTLMQALRTCAIKGERVWTRGGSTGLLTLTSRLCGQSGPAAEAEGRADVLARRRRRLANPLARLAWSWLVAADQVATYNLRARLPALFGRVVVLDRYAYDTAVEMDLSLPARARWSRLAIEAMLRLVPRPDRAYVLDVSPSTAQSRAADQWHPDVSAQRSRYHELAQRLDLALLSTEGAFGDANDRLVREVVMTYMAEFETWLNAVFQSNPSQLNVPDPVWARGVTECTC